MSESLRQEQCQLHHFQFTWNQIYEDFRRLTEDEIKDTLNSLEKLLINKCEPGNEDLIKREMKELTDLYLERAEEPLEKFKETTKEIFMLPPNMVLPGNVAQKVVPSEEIDKLRKEVAEFENQYQKEIHYRKFLKKESEKFECIKPLYDKVNEKLTFYKNNQLKPGEKSIEELYDALKSSEEFYLSKKYGSKDKPKTGITDGFGLFQVD